MMLSTDFTEENASIYEVNNSEMVELGNFKQLVKSASTAAAGLPLSDLPKAFQLSFGLIEKVSDLMLSAFTPTKNKPLKSVERSNSSAPDCSLFYSNNELTKSTGSNTMGKISNFHPFVSLPNVFTKPTESKSLDFESTKLDAEMPSKPPKPESYCQDEPEILDDDCAHSETHEQRPHSSHSSTSSSLVSSEPQPGQDTVTLDNSKNASTANSETLNDGSTHKRGSQATCTKTEDDILADLASDLPDAGKCALELRPQKSFRHFPSVMGSSHTSTIRDLGLGMRNPTDLRRWRLTSTDRLNTLIDECERQMNGRKLYVCKFCGKVYEIKSSMRYHMKIIHLQMHLRTTEMQCRICGKQFTCVSAVNRHQSKCMLSTYTEGGLHRSKHYSFSLSGTTGSSTPFPDAQSTNCPGSFMTSEAMTITGSLSVARASEDDETTSRQQSVTSSAFHHTAGPSDQLTPSRDSTYPVVPKPMCPPDSYGLLDSAVSATGTGSCCFPPTCHLRSYNCPIPSDLSGESYWNPTSTPLPWPTFPNLGYNLSDLSPVQLEMCMKAMVRGIHSNINGVNSTGSVPAAESSTCLPKASPSPCTASSSETFGATDLHRSSFSSTHTTTSSEVSDVEHPFGVTRSDEVAMDLSARSHTDSMMIETFS